MTSRDVFRFNWWDDVGTVKTLVDRWDPQNCRIEKDYERSLYEFLHHELPEVQITKQYAKGRVRVDMQIGKSIFLELKTNLDATDKYQRLIGQLAELKEWSGTIIVLLTGVTDPNLAKAVREHVQDWTGMLVHVPKVHVLEKRTVSATAA